MTVVFNDLAEARAALAEDKTIPLQTAPGAAAYGGVGYLMAIIDKAGADKSSAVIDCGDDAAIVLAALRTGWKRLLFSGRADVLVKLSQIAGQQGAEVLEPPK